jgi:hypothetical protein
VFADGFFDAFYALSNPPSPLPTPATTVPTDAPTTAAPTDAPTTAPVTPITQAPVVSTLPALAWISVLVTVVQGTAAAPEISLRLTATVTSLDAAGEAAVKINVKRTLIAHASVQGITITDADFQQITIRFVGADRDASQSFAARARRAFDDQLQRNAIIVIKVALQDTVCFSKFYINILLFKKKYSVERRCSRSGRIDRNCNNSQWCQRWTSSGQIRFRHCWG